MRKRLVGLMGLLLLGACGVGGPLTVGAFLRAGDFRQDCPGYSDSQILNAIEAIQQAKAMGTTKDEIVTVITTSCNVDLLDPAAETQFQVECQRCFGAIGSRVYGF